jgi:hypothetical protein
MEVARCEERRSEEVDRREQPVQQIRAGGRASDGANDGVDVESRRDGRERGIANRRFKKQTAFT